MKLKSTTIKFHEGDRYVFKNGIAVVPGVLFARELVHITLKEFNDIVPKKKRRR